MTDPDFPDIPLGGWTGSVGEVNQRTSLPLYLVVWNQHTLEHLHPVYRKRCERDDLEIESMWLSEEDLEPATGEPVPLEQPRQLSTLPLRLHDQDDRIRAALELTSDDPLPAVDEQSLHQYHAYLARQLTLPFQARYEEETGPFESILHPITVTALLDPDECAEDEGLLCVALQGAEQIVLPLAELDVGSRGRNQQLIEDYGSWLWNGIGSRVPFVNPSRGSWQAADPAPESASPKAALVLLASAILVGLLYGGTVGAALTALDGAALAAKVGAVLLGVIVGLFGAFYGVLFGVANRLQRGSRLGGVVGAVLGAAVGGLLGAMLMAFLGVILGGLAGWILGKLIRWKFQKPLATFLGAIAGGMLGMGIQAWLHSAEDAWSGTWIGGVSGAIAGLVLVFALGLAVMLSERNQTRRGWLN